MNDRVWITVTDEKGVVLDRFLLTKWDTEIEDEIDDHEGCGSPMSNSFLINRLAANLED